MVINSIFSRFGAASSDDRLPFVPFARGTASTAAAQAGLTGGVDVFQPERVELVREGSSDAIVVRPERISSTPDQLEYERRKDLFTILNSDHWKPVVMATEHGEITCRGINPLPSVALYAPPQSPDGTGWVLLPLGLDPTREGDRFIIPRHAAKRLESLRDQGIPGDMPLYIAHQISDPELGEEIGRTGQIPAGAAFVPAPEATKRFASRLAQRVRRLAVLATAPAAILTAIVAVVGILLGLAILAAAVMATIALILAVIVGVIMVVVLALAFVGAALTVTSADPVILGVVPGPLVGRRQLGMWFELTRWDW